MAVMTSTGTKIFVSAASPATRDSTGYAALTYNEVKEIVSISAFGVSRDPVEVRTLSSGALQSYKGHANYGAVSGEMNYDSEDTGQNLVRANILDNVAELSVKVLLPDGSIVYSGGMSFNGQRNPGSANSMIGSSFEIRFNHPPVEVAAP